MSRYVRYVLLATALLTTVLVLSRGFGLFDDAPAARPLAESKKLEMRVPERSGVLVPLYVYPANIEQNPDYNRLMDLRRQYEMVPMWIIVNPASGPGERVDVHYTEAIDRLRGAGCVVLGYVTTGYGTRSLAEVQEDIDQWLKLYPRTQGIFFDEMIHEDTDAGAKHQEALSRYARDAGCSVTVANPGTDTPGRYFVAGAADVIVVHEGGSWPSEELLQRQSTGAFANCPPSMRGVLLHSQPQLDRQSLQMVLKYARWVYVTEAVYRPGDPGAANPWNRLSKHLEEICAHLAER